MMIKCLETGKKVIVRKDSDGNYLIKNAMDRLLGVKKVQIMPQDRCGILRMLEVLELSKNAVWPIL
jgi:hypothetical protein